MAARRKLGISFWQGWNLALGAVRNAVTEVPEESLTTDQNELKSGILDFLDTLFQDEDLLKPKPTNAQLAAKYAVSLRTITNWRKEGCPFGDGQWKVLDWMADRRYVPVRAKAKFQPQLEKRNGTLDLENMDPLAKVALIGKVACRYARMARLVGLL